MLGDFLLVADDTPIVTVKLSRVQSLLAYLLLHRSAPQMRSHLAFLLWPDSTEVQAHSNLRKLLHQLRQTLPAADALLYADRHQIGWRGDTTIWWTLDVQDFEQAVASAKRADAEQDWKTLRETLEQAVSLYRGDLLPACFDEWIAPERERVRGLFLWCMKRLLILLEQERDYETAIQIAQRFLRFDPLQEEVYRHVMRLFALNNDRAAALHVYQTCVAVFQRELSAEPSKATRQVYESLLQADSAASAKHIAFPARSKESKLIGRKAEWRYLQMAWNRAVSGHPHLVILSGDAGIGKTRLAEEMVAWVQKQGMSAALARCYAAEGQLPYAPVAAWLRTDMIQNRLATLADVWLTEIARLLPQLLTSRADLPHPAPMTEGWQRLRFFEALAHALLSVRQPLLLVLDDLHWCDLETVHWLQYFFQFTPQARILLIGTMRSEEILSADPLLACLHTWQRDDLVSEYPLGPLSTSEVASLAHQMADRQIDAAVLSHVSKQAEGNPLFVIELIQLETTTWEGSVQRTEEATRPLLHPVSPLPSKMQSVLTARFAHLSPPVRDLAHLAAVIGREFSFAVLVRASGQGEETVVAGLDELWQRRIIREHEGNSYYFHHEMLREAAFASLSPPQRSLLHQRVAEALVQLFADNLASVSQQIAHHYEQAGLLERAASFYLDAGKAAQSIYAQQEALFALQRAVTLLSSPGYLFEERQEQKAASVYEHLGDVLEMMGKHQEATETYRQALTHVAAHEILWRVCLLRKMATTHDYPPHLAEALQEYQEAEHLLTQLPSSSDEEQPTWYHEWIEIQLGQLHVCFMLLRVEQMTEIIERMRHLLDPYATAPQQADFLLYSALRDAVQSRYVVSQETVTLCRMGLSISEKTGNPHLIGSASFGLGYCLFLADEFDEAEDALQRAGELGEQVGDAELVARCRLHFLPLVFRRRGQAEPVRRTIEQALAQGEKRYRGVLIAQQAWLAWRDGNSEEAQALGKTALDIWHHQSPVYAFQWTGLWPIIGAALAGEQYASAIDAVRLLLAGSQQRPPGPLLALLDAATRAWEAGQRETVQALLHQALPLAQNTGYL